MVDLEGLSRDALKGRLGAAEKQVADLRTAYGELLEEREIKNSQLAALRASPPEPIEGMRKAMQEACDLLAERIHGSHARSPGHNARLVLEAALRAMPLQDHGWQDISTAPEDERVELFNELWECTFGEIQIGILDDDGKWSFDSGMNVYDTDNDAGNQDDGLAEIDFTPTHWRPLPRRPMVAEDGMK